MISMCPWQPDNFNIFDYILFTFSEYYVIQSPTSNKLIPIFVEPLLFMIFISIDQYSTSLKQITTY